MSDTVTVWHPDKSLVNADGSRHSREVAKADVEAWHAQGWLKTEPKESKDAKAAAEAAQ